MKKLISLILLAFISIQMWAVNQTMKVYIVGIDGTTYTKSTTENTYGKISVTFNVTGDGPCAWNTSDKGYRFVLQSSNNKFNLTATDIGDYEFIGWYDGQYSTSHSKNSSRTWNNSDKSGWGSSSNLYAHFRKKVTNVTVAVDYATGSNNTMGTIGGGKTVAAGTNVTLTASATGNNTFRGWSTTQNGNNILSNSNVSSYQVSASNATYYAVFEAGPVAPSAGSKEEYTVTPGEHVRQQVANVSIPNFSKTVDLGFDYLWADRNVGALSTSDRGTLYSWTDAVALSSANLGGEGWRLPTDNETYNQTLSTCSVNKNGYAWYLTRSGYNNVELIFYGGSGATAHRCWLSQATRAYFGVSGSAPATVTYNSTESGTSINYGVRPIFDLEAAGIKKLEIKMVKGDETSTNIYYCANNQQVDITPATVPGYTPSWTSGVTGETTGTKSFTVTSNTTATITYTQSTVTATYKQADGTTNFATKEVVPSNAPGDPTGTPQKDPTNTIVYTFDRWNTAADGTGNGTNVAISGPTTYYPIFTESTRTYTIRFQNYDGTDVISAITNATYGSTPEAPADNLVKAKPATNTKTYSFSGWSPTVSEVTGDQTYTAQFSESERHYTIRFLNYDGTVISSDANATYNATVVAPSEDPVRDGYVFTGWNPAVTTVSQDQDYIAQFALPQYDLTIGGYSNGTITIKVDGSPAEVVPAGGHTYQYEELTTIIVTATPDKGSHVEWAITGTVQQMGNAIRVNQITENVTINPTFAGNTSFAINDTWTEEQWKNTASDDATATDINGKRGQVLDVTLSGRSFTVGQWATLSVPFDCNLDKDDALYGAVYGFSNASMASANSVNIEFIRTYDIKANTPYLIIPRKNIPGVVFYGVKLVAAAEMKAESLHGTDVDFVSAPWPTTLYNPEFYVSSGTSLRFARTTENGGTTMNGNRAFFRQTGGSSAPRRVRIVIDGEESEIEIAEDGTIEEVQNVRKYMENGRLVIECNGIRMDATGARIN